jgi:uncharacterized RDD family membrane protein YckC
VGFLITKLAPELAYRIAFGEADQADIFFIFFLAFTLSDLLYYTFCEKVFKGYTLGKLITGSRAISADGSELTFKQAILRSLSRMVPFEPFSALGANPWHDSWTKTVVIKSR